MIEGINEIISNQLPAQVGAVLKSRLEQADVLENENRELKLEIGAKQQKIAELEAEVSKHLSISNRESDLTKKEADISERERNAEIEALKMKLECSESNTKFARDVALGLVRNTSYRKNIFDSEVIGQPVTDGNGHVYYPTPTSKSHLSTETID